MFPADDAPTVVALTVEDPVEIGPYQVLRLLGEGGMGKVYLARSAGARLVALKVIRSEFAADPDFRARFRREVAAAGRVSGFFTAPVVDADADAPQSWLATVYVPAPALGEVVRLAGPVTEPGLRALGAGLAEALMAIHSAGLVHRDLKPGNVLVTEDGPRVIDFGISRALDGTQVTRTGSVIGTPGYMSPEQIASGREVGPLSDVFSLGCVLAFAATGANPYGTGTSANLLYRVVYAPPTLDGVPAGLVPLIEACLDKDPARRPAVAALLGAFGPVSPDALITPPLRAELLRRGQDAAGSATMPVAPRTRLDLRQPTLLATEPAPAPSRRRFLGIAAATAVTVAAGGTAIALLRSGESGTATANPTSSRATAAAPAAPQSPSPVWTQEIPVKADSGNLEVVGDTVIRWWDRNAALAFDAATGSPRWTGTPTLPETAGRVTWLGVRESILYGAAEDYKQGNALLFGLDVKGKQVFRCVAGSVRTPPGTVNVYGLFDARGGIALIHIGKMGTSPTMAIAAVEVSSGKPLWSRDLEVPATAVAVADDRRCYLQDGATTYGLDLRTGTKLWATPNTSSAASASVSAVLVGGGLVICSTRLVALDLATGKERWSAVHDSASLGQLTVAGDQVVVTDQRHTIRSINAKDGVQQWSTQSPVPVSSSDGDRYSVPFASESLIAMPTSAPYGVLTLRGATGKPLWAHLVDPNPHWSVAATKDTVYAATPTALYAFKDQP